MEQDSERKTRKYWEMLNALGIMYWPIIEVAVYKTYPDWLISQISFRKLNRDESRRMKLFFSGLDKLTGIWGMSS